MCWLIVSLYLIVNELGVGACREVGFDSEVEGECSFACRSAPDFQRYNTCISYLRIQELYLILGGSRKKPGGVLL